MARAYLQGASASFTVATSLESSIWLPVSSVWLLLALGAIGFGLFLSFTLVVSSFLFLASGLSFTVGAVLMIIIHGGCITVVIIHSGCNFFVHNVDFLVSIFDFLVTVVLFFL